MNAAHHTSLKAKLGAGQTVIGCLVAFDAPWLVEVIGRAGFDFMTIDIEHEAFDESGVVNLIRSAEVGGLSSIVRMSISDRLLPYLDAGVSGVKVPDLRDRRHAEELVSLTHFHPEGRRTYYTMGRAAHYGIDIDDHEWMAGANDSMFLMAMIEDIAVVDQLDDILEVKGIDAFHVGPHDLAQSMGFPPPAELDAVIKRVVHRCLEAGRYVSVGVVTPWNLAKARVWMDEGCQIMTVGSSWVISHAMVEMHNQLRDSIPADRQSRTQLSAVSRSSYLTGATKAK
jgi:2-keto-3-deoxy-L-rhamnonate aldolase RhmA